MRQDPTMTFVVNSLTNDIMVTASLHVLDKDRRFVECRGLLDTCSTTNFMTETLADRLKLRRKLCQVPIGALNSMTTYSKEMTTTDIKSRINEFQKTLTFLIVPEISSSIPDQPIQRDLIHIPANISLADPDFHKPAPVDILLGAGTTLSLLSVGQIQLSSIDKKDLFLQKTLLGWIIGGAVPLTQPSSRRTCHVTSTLQFELSKFWELEECPKETPYTVNEQRTF